MNFFEHQGVARRNTKLMVFLFALAVIAVITAVDVVLGVLYAWSSDQPPTPALFVAGALATGLLILCVSLFNVARLSEGGVAVARLVGARPGEVVMMNTLTANLHFMMATFYRPTAERHAILIESGAFLSDTYAAASQVRHHGGDPERSLIVARPRPGDADARALPAAEFMRIPLGAG